MTYALKAFRKMFRQLLPLALLATAGGAGATSTDGYHTIQVVPMTVLSQSFVTSLFIHNPNATPINVRVTYYPGTDYDPLLVTAPTPVSCGDKVVAAGRVAQFANVTALCPGAPLPPPSRFGWIWAEEVTANATGPHRPFNIFTRVDNVQGIAGFETESYPPHTFTGTSWVWVTGLKRLAGGGGAAPNQTNCFAAALGEATTIQMTVLDGGTGAVIAGPLNVNLAPRQMFRFLDIFVKLGDLTAGADVPNGILRVSTSANGAGAFPGSIVFCTVQNNTTLDADFRIGKASPVFDLQVQRLQGQIVDEAGIQFALGNYPSERNRHVVYFKHPDVVKCDLNNTDGTPKTAGSGMEIKLLDPEGVLRAGGTGAKSFADVYTGDKSKHRSGANGMWLIDVQAQAGDASGTSNGATYQIICRSGSGHGAYEWIGRGLGHDANETIVP